LNDTTSVISIDRKGHFSCLKVL